MENVVTENGVDPRQQSWDEFVEKANRFINSGEMVKEEIEYKLEIACKVASAPVLLTRTIT